MVAEALAKPRLIRPPQPPVPIEVVARLLAGLNREQRQAVTHRDGPQLVIAGPGTGKTEVVTRRIAWLIATRRALPRQILALTFTDNAAEEMQARVDLLVPYGQADTEIHTFHAYGDRLLREHAFELGLPGDLRLIGRAEAIVLLRDHLFELGLDRYRPLGDPTRFLGALVDLFSRAKDEGIEPDALARYATRLAGQAAADDAVRDMATAHTELASAYRRYSELTAQMGLIDHGDQLGLALRLLHERPATRASIIGRFRYLLVDEFQDMNRAQLAMVDALTGPARNVTVVGDPDQAIYTFRGAASDSVGHFGFVHPDLRRVVLRRNYRSRRPVLEAAGKLIEHAPAASGARSGQVAARRSGRPQPVRLVTYASPEAEADGVAQAIAARIGTGQRPRDFAVLARSNGEIEPIVRSLTVRGIAARTHTPADFFRRPAVRPLLAFLRAVDDPTNTVELYVLATAWPYELGGEPLTELMTRARRGGTSLWRLLCEQADGPTTGARTAVGRLVSDMRAAIELAHVRSAGEVLYDHLRRSGRLARLAEDGHAADARAVARFFDTVRSRSSLLADERIPSLVPHLDALVDAEDERLEDGPPADDAVSVLTVHRAKGLEFPVVYLTGLADGRFPSRSRPATITVSWPAVRGESASGNDDQLAEERRLCFVAMTRARDELWLSTHATGPGGRGRRRPSPFIAEALDLPVDSAPPAGTTSATVSAWGAPQAVVAAEPAANARPTVMSFSQIEEYLDCPERYRLRHVVGLPTPAHHALSYGRALHEAVAWFHVQAGKSQPPSVEETLEVFHQAWSPEGFLSREHEQARLLSGEQAVRAFHAAQLADPAPVVAVERPFEFQLDGVRIRGRMDRVDSLEQGSRVVDYKSSDVREQKRADEKARDSLQLQVYALAQQAATGTLPVELQLHFLDSGVVGRTTPDGARLERARAKINAAFEGIAAGNFQAKPNAISCGYCPFRRICPSSAA